MRRRVPRVERRATSWASRFCCQGNSWVTSVLGNAYSSKIHLNQRTRECCCKRGQL